MYMYEQDLALNYLQGLKCHKTQPTNQPMPTHSHTGTLTSICAYMHICYTYMYTYSCRHACTCTDIHYCI